LAELTGGKMGVRETPDTRDLILIYTLAEMARCSRAGKAEFIDTTG
jgi:hypothetical protein